MHRWASTLASVAIAATLAAPASASTVRTYNPTASAAASTPPPPAPAAAAPSVPAGALNPAAPAPSSGSTGNGDVLAANGLRSPFCALFQGGRAGENCAASGVPYSPAPDSHLTFDVHIDSGGGVIFDSGDAIKTMLDNTLNFFWQVMVAVTHALFFLLEWAFSLNLISSPAFPTAHLTSEIRQITLPFMAIATALFGVWVVWVALVYRRHQEAVKSALHALVLCILALAVLYNPIATVGDVVGVSQRFGMLVIGAAAGQPGNAQASFESGLEAMYTGLIEKPAGLLEFGDVDWATNPARLSQPLRATALTLAHANNNPGELRAVQAARNNLELFTAFPPNGPERNSINQTSPMSLLRALCTTSDATKCAGPTASQAEFRTAGSVGERVVAMALVTPVLLAMWLLLGWIAAMLLASSVMALFYLLALGYMALVVFFGHSGRQRFQSYARSFGGTLVSAAVFAALLGLVMDTWRVLMALNGLGFVLQWLLVLVLLLVVFVRRHAIWGVVRSSPQDLGQRTAKRWARRAAYYYVGDKVRSNRAEKRRENASGQSKTGDVAPTRTRPPRRPRPGPTADPAPAGPAAAAAGAGAGAGAVLLSRRPRSTLPRGARDGAPVSPDGPQESQLLRARQERSLLIGAFHAAQSAASHATAPDGPLQSQAERLPRREEALAAATTTLAAAREPRERERLRRRQQSLQRRAGESQQAAAKIERVTRGAEQAKRARFAADGSPRDFRGEDFERARGWLDRQATLGRGAPPAASTRESRDYPRLAGIVGQTPAVYHRAPAREQLRMRANIDRELDRRVGLARHGARARTPQPASHPRPVAAAQAVAPPRRAPAAPRRPAGGRDAFAREVRRTAPPPARTPRRPPPRPPRP